jgi:hypothetical protein
MRVSGKVRAVRADGYERFIEVACDGLAHSLWLSALDPNYYVQDSSKFIQMLGQFKVGESVNLEVFITLVGKVKVHKMHVNLGLSQPIRQSPHSRVVGRITNCVAPSCFECSLGEPGQVIVFEVECPQLLEVGQLVEFTGELTLAG